MTERVDRDLRAERVRATRPAVEAAAAKVNTTRQAAAQSAREVGRRLAPSGGLGAELRARPLRAIGLAGAALLLIVRWARRGSDSGAAPHTAPGRGAARAFLGGIAAGVAARGGRAIVDALVDGVSPRTDSPSANEDREPRGSA
jgi:hypothetical protein